MASDTPPSRAAFRAGIVILVAALVISFVAAEKIESYYFEEKVIDDDEEQTWKDTVMNHQVIGKRHSRYVRKSDMIFIQQFGV